MVLFTYRSGMTHTQGDNMKAEDTERIAQAFINQLAQGNVPWRKPWSADGTAPRNYQTQRPYRGINTLILGIANMEHGYQSPCWTTFKAAAAQGAYVRKGEKSTPVVFWKRIKVEDKATGTDKVIPLMRLYPMFNTDQVDGITWTPSQRDPVDVPVALKQLIADYPNPPSITHAAGDRAYYQPSTDAITMPLLGQFDTTQGYAETICHELVHSTGHTSRLGRFDNNHVGHSGDYAKEELVAEIGASMLMQNAGIPVDMPQMGAYVQSWLRALQDDHSLIVKAAQAAQKAVDHIQNTTFKEDNT
jgi:antirestriction protein ArdC